VVERREWAPEERSHQSGEKQSSTQTPHTSSILFSPSSKDKGLDSVEASFKCRWPWGILRMECKTKVMGILYILLILRDLFFVLGHSVSIKIFMVYKHVCT
jgi:hypothetical protein